MIDALGFAMALQFKPDGKGGWLYRKDQIGPALPATQAERDGYVRWHGWMVVLSVPLLLALVIGFAIVASATLGEPDGLGPLAAIFTGLIPMALIYLFVRWTSHAPARAFAGRIAAEGPRTRKAVLGKRMARMTDRRLLEAYLTIVIIMTIGALRVPYHPQMIWLILGMPAAICLGFRWWRWRVETS